MQENLWKLMKALQSAAGRNPIIARRRWQTTPKSVEGRKTNTVTPPPHTPGRKVHFGKGITFPSPTIPIIPDSNKKATVGKEGFASDLMPASIWMWNIQVGICLLFKLLDFLHVSPFPPCTSMALWLLLQAWTILEHWETPRSLAPLIFFPF